MKGTIYKAGVQVSDTLSIEADSDFKKEYTTGASSRALTMSEMYHMLHEDRGR